MKSSIIALSLLVSFSSFAQDMSRTEKYETSYVENEDGSTSYVGGCSLHQDYEGKYFTVDKTIVETFEPGHKEDPSIAMAKVKHVDRALLEAAGSAYNSVEEFITGVDDFTLEKISSTVFKGLDLYRFNVGVGGGNGYYEVYNRAVVKGKTTYTRVSNVFDGDMEFCDKSVWLTKK